MKLTSRPALRNALASFCGGLASVTCATMVWASAPDAAAAAMPMQRNTYGVYTVDVTVGRGLLFSGNPEADPIPFIVDTGANRTAVPRLIASQLIADEQISFDQIAHAVTGPFATGLFFINQLDFGMGPREVEVAIFEEDYGSVMSAAGILGSNAFTNEVIVLDYPALELRRERGISAPADMPLRIENGIIIGEGRVRGVPGPVRVFVDTGANASIVNTALVRRRGPAVGRQATQIEGVSGGAVARGETRRLVSNFEVSELCSGGFTVAVSDLYFFDGMGWAEEPSIILGMDFLQHARITIDYGNASARIEGTGHLACP